VVVVLSGRLHTLTRCGAGQCRDQLFPPGEEGGNGLTDILTGAVNPVAVPVSLPRMVEQVPIYRLPPAATAMFFDDYTDCPRPALRLCTG
jgi:hypothetical protein